MTRKRIAILTTVGLFIAVSVISVPIVKFIIGIHLHFRRHEEKQLKILYEIDHEEMLQACREIIENRRVYARKMGWDKAPPQIFDLDSGLPSIPAILRDLEPRDITVTIDGVSVEFHGGHWHWGLYAFPERLVDSPPFTGNVEIIPGLWFYDNEYFPGIEKLKKLKPRDAPEPSWWNAPPIHSSPTPTPVFPESSRVWKVD